VCVCVCVSLGSGGVVFRCVGLCVFVFVCFVFRT